MWWNHSTDTNVIEEGGGGGILGAKAVILLPPVEVHGEADIHPEAHGGPYTREGCMKEAAVHKNSTHWSRFLMEITTLWREAYAEEGFLSGPVA